MYIGVCAYCTCGWLCKGLGQSGCKQTRELEIFWLLKNDQGWGSWGCQGCLCLAVFTFRVVCRVWEGLP
jgi:hypothetical protein